MRSNWTEAGFCQKGLRTRWIGASMQYGWTYAPFTLAGLPWGVVRSRENGRLVCKAGLRRVPVTALSERERGEEKQGGKEPEHFCRHPGWSLSDNAPQIASRTAPRKRIGAVGAPPLDPDQQPCDPDAATGNHLKSRANSCWPASGPGWNAGSRGRCRASADPSNPACASPRSRARPPRRDVGVKPSL